MEAYFRKGRNPRVGFPGRRALARFLRHEIPITAWMDVFKEIHALLHDGGVVLIMEDQRMKVGELPTSHGFLVLDDVEVAALFNASPDQEVRALPGDQSGRLSRIEIRRSVLPRINAVTIGDALTRVLGRAKDEIGRIRAESEPSIQTGRLHAYYAMLYTNAALAQNVYPKASSCL